MEIKILDNTTLDFFQDERHLLSLKIYPEKQMLVYQWIDFIAFQTVIEAYYSIGKFLKENTYKITKGIQDLSQSKGSFEEHNEWMVKVYLPKALEKGYRCTAFIKPTDLFAQLALDFLLEINPEGHIYQIFDDFETAKNWLEQQ